MIPLLLAPMMKACPLEESYHLPDDLFCQTMSYITVSLILLLLFSLSGWAHHSPYDWLLCSSVYFISSWRASSIAKSLTSRSAMPTFASIFVMFFLSNTCQGRFSIYKIFVDSIPPPPISCIPKTHWKLIEYHMSAAYWVSSEWCLVHWGRWRGKWWLLRRLSCFFLSWLHSMVEAIPLLCSEINMQNESWWEVVWRCDVFFLKSS